MKKHTEKNSVIGLLGGVFDPIHNGHLYIANTLMQQLPLTHIRFIPCKQQVLKNSTHASATHRLAMLQRAIKPYTNFSIDTRELDRDTPSYTVDTLQSLRDELPDTPLALIMGMDAFLSLPQWHEWQRLFLLAHIIVVNRPHVALPISGLIADILNRHISHTPSDLQNKIAGHIFMHSIEPTPISSTQIRDMIVQKKDVSDLMPTAVHRYIQQEHVYDTNEK